MRKLVARSCVVLFFALSASACGSSSTPTSPTTPAAPEPAFSQTDLVVGSGATVSNGRFATVYYTLWIYDAAAVDRKGRQVETNVGGTPYRFLVGAGGVIRGWDLGVPGMRVGGTRRLIVPSSLAYGPGGSGTSIPGNTTLVFDIELLNVE